MSRTKDLLKEYTLSMSRYDKLTYLIQLLLEEIDNRLEKLEKEREE